MIDRRPGRMTHSSITARSSPSPCWDRSDEMYVRPHRPHGFDAVGTETVQPASVCD
jgi:hypothetical protein